MTDVIVSNTDYALVMSSLDGMKRIIDDINESGALRNRAMGVNLNYYLATAYSTLIVASLPTIPPAATARSRDEDMFSDVRASRKKRGDDGTVPQDDHRR